MSKEFENLVAQAVALERELRTLEGETRASAACWFDHCLALGNSDHQKLSALRVEFEARREVFPQIRFVIGHLVQGFSRGNYPWPSTKVENMATVLRSAGSEQAVSELTELGMSRWELFALAVEEAARRHPQVFGDVDDMRARESRIMELKLKRRIVLEKLNTSWEQNDLHIHEIRSDGAALITFQIAMPELVPVAPKRDCGERLIAYLANQQDDAAWASEVA